MTSIEIRLATLEDIPEIWEDIQSSFKDVHTEFIATGQEGYLTYLKDFVGSGMSENKKLFVGILGGQLAGFADVTLNELGSNFLTRISTFPEHRGKGVASLLMRGIATSQVASHEWELDVLESNYRARKLYSSRGFETIAIKKWIGRMIEPWHVSKLIENDDFNYSRYGFTSTTIDGLNVSIAGNAVRCSGLQEFIDDQFLRKVQLRFPNVRIAFIILDDGTEIHQEIDSFTIIRSHRMKGVF